MNKTSSCLVRISVTENSIGMNIDKNKKKKKEMLPGQQIGLYGKADKKDVRQMVKILNPDKNSMESRG
jgi:phosphoribosylaminoimidazole carboxylase (NCAIR synthetase)